MNISHHPFISFDYCKINEININCILSNILNKTKLPDCVINEIGKYLFGDCQKKKIMKIFYEQKCDNYIVSRETVFQILKINFYDFIVLFIKTIIIKFYVLNQSVIIPHMRQDIYYFKTCMMNNNEFVVNKKFLHENNIVFLVLFCEVYHDFKNDDTYFCLYNNNYSKINNKYVNYLEKIKRQIFL